MIPENGRPSLDSEAGATLIELLMSIVISGILLSALTMGIMSYMRSANATRALMSETGELQVAATHFSTDVQAAETVQAGAATAACGTFPAGSTPLVDFAWDDYETRTVATPISVSYVYVPVANEIRRTACEGLPAVVEVQQTLVRHVQPSQTPQVLCNGSPACSATPRQVDVSLLVCTVDGAGVCLNTPIPAKVTGVRRLS